MQQQKMIHEQHTQYIHALEKVNADMQKFRHDYMNILLSLRELIDTEDTKNLKTYFYETILPIEKNTLFENKLMGELGHIKVLELKGILSSKLLYASQLNIPVTLEIPQQIQKISIDSIDLTRIIGVLMDNAIEASQDLEEPRIHIAVFQDEQQTIIIIENLFQNKQFEVSSLFEKPFSTKGVGRGHGLINIKAVLNRYLDVVMHTRVNGNRFIQELEIEENGGDNTC